MRRAVLLVLLGLLAPLTATAEPLVVDLSRHRVEITTGFSGTDLLLFGAIEPGRGPEPEDVVVVVRGPDTALTLRHKTPSFGLWINQGAATIAGVPAFHHVAATRPLAQVAGPALRETMAIGLEPPPAAVRIEAADGTGPDGYRAALVRLLRARGLYGEAEAGVAVMNRRLFRTELHLPASVPVGTYRVEVHVLARGRLIGSRSTPLVVDRVGVGAMLHDVARTHAVLYGLGAVAMAAGAGWLAARLFGRG